MSHMTAIACRRRDDCRLCGGRSLELVFQLAATPPANAFVSPGQSASLQERFPLDVFFCRDCTHLQLRDVVDPAVLFEHYVYVSGTSPVFVDHFRRYAEDVIARFGVPTGAFVLDIGSNDGTLLRFFQHAEMKALGVDPAREIAAQATRSGIETINDFFGRDLALRLRRERGAASVITANNVFAHADDLKAIAEGARDLLAQDGVFVIEVSYLADVVEKTLFDTIYHEHVAYHSVGALKPFFARCSLELIDVQHVDSHGGSLRAFAQRAGGPRPVSPSVAQFLEREAKAGLNRPETFRRFAQDIEERKRELLQLLKEAKAAGKRVAGFGAPAKATTLMYHFDLGPQFLDFIVDDSPLKQGLLSPGFHIPVLPSAEIEERKPDYLLILAWNFAPSIMAKQEKFHKAGGRFIVPLPTVEVI